MASCMRPLPNLVWFVIIMAYIFAFFLAIVGLLLHNLAIIGAGVVVFILATVAFSCPACSPKILLYTVIFALIMFCAIIGYYNIFAIVEKFP